MSNTLDQWPTEATDIQDTDLMPLKRGTGANSDKKITGANVKTQFATPAQGALADSASQPGHTHVQSEITDLGVVLLANGSQALTGNWVTGAFDIDMAGGYLNVNGISLQSQNGIYTTVGDESIFMAGGDSPSQGGGVRYYGQSHATKASDIRFFAPDHSDLNVRLEWEHSNLQWNFKGSHVLGAGDFKWGGDTVQIWNTDNTNFLGLYAGGAATPDTSQPQIRMYHSENTAGGIAITGMTAGIDRYPGPVQLQGQSALPAAVTNLKGGDIELQAGKGASGAAGDAEGGWVIINGGIGYGTGKYGGVYVEGHNLEFYLGDDAGDATFTIYDTNGDPLWSIDSLGNIIPSSALNKVVSGTTYTILAADNGYNLIFTNASAIAVTLPDTLDTNFHCTIVQAGAGVPTVTPNTDTINGAGTGVAPSAQWKGMYLNQYEATNWYAIL